MNCATHSNTAAVAYCRTCGKPLCAACTRDVRGTIFCEACLADRLTGVIPPTPAVVPPTAVPPGSGALPPAQPPYSSSGPNPALAGILAGFFPVGVGAVYNGQYAKGLAHLVIMVGTIVALSSNLPWFMNTILGISLGFFYFYQIIDAVRSARAIQLGQPAPDPFGLAQTFAAGEKVDTSKIPMGALILIGLGVVFLLHTVGLFEFGLQRFWPLILMFLGGWLFARRWGLLDHNGNACHCERCRSQYITGPSVLFTLGLLFLLDSTNVIGFSRTWPLILLVIGGIKLLQSNASTEGHIVPPPAFPGAAANPPAGPTESSHVSQPQPSSEVNNV